MSSLPERFKTRIINQYGEQGIHWLRSLPALRESLVKRWSLQDCQPVSPLSYNYLEFAHSPDHGPVVLKIGFPNPELFTEIKALDCYRRAKGAVRLLDWDGINGGLLLERISPGYNLTSLADDRLATRIAGKAMIDLRLPEPAGSDFPTIEKWCQGFSRYQEHFTAGGGPLPADLFDHAYGLARDLLGSSTDRYLLHGDLHHNNLLFQEGGTWVVIDPKGVIGEFACEIGPYLCNPVPDLIHRPNLEKVLDLRLGILAGITGLDRQRLASWSFSRAVLSAIWSVEEGEDSAAYWVEIAEVIRRLVIK